LDEHFVMTTASQFKGAVSGWCGIGAVIVALGCLGFWIVSVVSQPAEPVELSFDALGFSVSASASDGNVTTGWILTIPLLIPALVFGLVAVVCIWSWIRKPHDQPRYRPRFTIRTLLTFTLVVAMALGWRVSHRNARQEIALQTVQLRYAEEELRRARDELKDRDRPNQPSSRNFWEAEFDGAYLRDVTISSPSNAFQRASLKNCDLQNATMEADTSAFQLAHFDGSNLAHAKLTGGGASFQCATFVGCDLTGAVLDGGGSSFQLSSFENATLVGARLAGSFQLVNISGAHFEGADLSALNTGSLQSCHFKDPPTYDAQTQFPAEFDPAANLWRRVRTE
jgi:uncharacterized protein YjbI with pentapeptide repeats